MKVGLVAPVGLPAHVYPEGKPLQDDAATAVDCVSVASEYIRTNSQEDAFFLCDLSRIEHQYSEWMTHLPRARPHYAVKCNPHPVILKLLAQLGCGFDCASKNELELALATGVSPSDVIYANPCKQISHMKRAQELGVNLMTFDNSDELYKIKEHFPEAHLVLRMLVDDSQAACRFSSKFGAAEESCPKLLKIARDLGLKVVGLSFHVGSGQRSLEPFLEAIRGAARVFAVARKILPDAKDTFSLLDIGGGFPGADPSLGPDNDCGIYQPPPFSEFAQRISQVLDECFDDNVRIIAEPGRYFVCASHTLVTAVIARRVVDRKDLDPNSHAQDDVPQPTAADDRVPGLAASVSTPGATKNVSSSSSNAIAEVMGASAGSTTLAMAVGMSDSLGSESVSSQDLSSRSSVAGSLEGSDVVNGQPLRYLYYINDGVYGSFNCLFFDHASVQPHVLPRHESLTGSKGATSDAQRTADCRIFGPTCDALDCVVPHTSLPVLNLGDWIYFNNMGAYTTAAASGFNGFEKTPIIFVSHKNIIK